MSELTVVERAKLENLEEVIQVGLRSFVDVGRALTEIRDGRLYRNSHETFEDYCKDRWGISKSYATQVIKAAKVVVNLDSVAIATKPANEAQARPLTSLPDAEQPAAWQEAMETAPNGKVTAKHVASVVQRRQDDGDDDIGDIGDITQNYMEFHEAVDIAKKHIEKHIGDLCKKLTKLDIVKGAYAHMRKTKYGYTRSDADLQVALRAIEVAAREVRKDGF